jgi:hypothetical protein
MPSRLQVTGYSPDGILNTEPLVEDCSAPVSSGGLSGGAARGTGDAAVRPNVAGGPEADIQSAFPPNVLNPLGVAVRASTRSYRGNSSDYRKLHLYQALDALAWLDRRTDDSPFSPDSDLRQVYSRLSLSDRTLGGLVRENKLSKFYDLETSRRVEAQAHNWELERRSRLACEAR